jgi:hypothetical protein
VSRAAHPLSPSVVAFQFLCDTGLIGGGGATCAMSNVDQSMGVQGVLGSTVAAVYRCVLGAVVSKRGWLGRGRGGVGCVCGGGGLTGER